MPDNKSLFTPLQSLNDKYGGWGTALGQGIANPIQQALDTLAHQKITQLAQRQSDMQRQQKADVFGKALPGFSPEQVMALTYLPEKELYEVFQHNFGQQRPAAQQEPVPVKVEPTAGEEVKELQEPLQGSTGFGDFLNKGWTQRLREESPLAQPFLPQQAKPQQPRQVQAQAPVQQQAAVVQQAQPPVAIQPPKTLFPLSEKQQARIEAVNKPYNTALEKRYGVIPELLDAAQEMKELWKEGVANGWSGYLTPRFSLDANSQRFANLGDDVANALTGLTTGVQTISKIKFNQERKANLGQRRETQLERINDILNLAGKVALEEDIKDYLIEQNGGKQPAELRTLVNKIYNKVESSMPPVPEGAEQGKIFKDSKTGAVWIVQGPIMRFQGFQGV